MTDDESVVLVTIDSIRSDYCGVADGDTDVMPTLAGMADDGLVFENAIAPAASTFASSTAFLTGMDAVERPGAKGGSRDELKTHVRGHMAARRSIAQTFADRGYETAAFTANPWTSRYFGYDAGFDHFEDFMDDDASSDFLEGGGSDGALGMLGRNAVNWWQGQDMFMTWEGLIDDIAEWTEAAEEPYFLWVFLVDPHTPYLPPSDYRTQSRLKTYPTNLAMLGRRDLPFESRLGPILTEAYENSLRYTDAFFDELQGLVDDPLIAVHGDHGEMFGERGMYGHGRQLYDHLVNVPLIVANGPNDRIEQPFSLRRLPALLDGLSRGEDDVAERLAEPYVFTATRMPNAAVRGRDWKYIWSPDDEELLAIDGHDETPIENEGLQSVGRDLVEWWRGSQAEKERVVAAAEELAAGGRV